MYHRPLRRPRAVRVERVGPAAGSILKWLIDVRFQAICFAASALSYPLLAIVAVICAQPSSLLRQKTRGLTAYNFTLRTIQALWEPS